MKNADSNGAYVFTVYGPRLNIFFNKQKGGSLINGSVQFGGVPAGPVKPNLHLDFAYSKMSRFLLCQWDYSFVS